MPEALQQLLAELEHFGAANDKATTERPKRMLNITRDTGEFLAVLVHATQARRILEIGTSNGYSTLWLANAARALDGKVSTVEFSEFKIELAAKNFSRAGLTPCIDQIHGDASRVLAQAGNDAFDLIFLDSERSEYPIWWPEIKRTLRPGGLLVVDNATSHPEEMAPFMSMVKADPGFLTSLVPIGNGEFLAVRVGG